MYIREFGLLTEETLRTNGPRMTAVYNLFLLLVIALSVQAARKVNVQERMLKAKRDVEEGLERSARAVMGLTKGEDLKEGRHVSTPHGNQKIKYQETYLGVPVEGASVVMEKAANGQFTHEAIGHLVENLDDDLNGVDPGFDANEAMHILARKFYDRPETVRFDPKRDAKLEVVISDEGDDVVSARLAYKLAYTVENSHRVSRPTGIVDADTGEVLKSWDGLSVNNIRGRPTPRVKSNYEINAVGGNEKIGKAKYGGSQYKKLQVTNIGNGTCILKNNVARVYNCYQSWDCSKYESEPFSFPCDEGYEDGINGAYSPLSDAMFYIDATYEMFSEWYGIEKPLQRAGESDSSCSARVHFGSAFENAFWDGYYITFGDGKDKFYPLTSINVVAHEISHGVTEMNSGLYYYGESGGMNEAFSDMSGEVVEFYASTKADWLVGYEIYKKQDGALRYFKKPSDDGRSVDDQSGYCPGMDPHFSSGIFNRAFYFLSVTKGWDLKNAFHPFVIANELYWTPYSTFYEAACGVVQAAKDLELKSEDVTEAFRKVRVEPCKDTRKGVSAMSEISAPAGHKVIYHVTIDKEMKMDTLSFSVQGRNVEAHLHTPGCDHCAKSHWFNNIIDVCDPVPGLYMIEFSSKTELVKAALTISGPTTQLLDNLTLANDNETILTTFHMPESAVKSGSQVILNVNVAKGGLIALIRHKEKPDFENFIFDYILWSGYPRTVCKVLPGEYYILFRTWNPKGATGISVFATHTLLGERIDTPPIMTRPPALDDNLD